MALTTRSRLGCIKSRQQRLQREEQRQIERQRRELESVAASAPTAPSVSKQDLVARKKALEKYQLAKSIYEATRDPIHWQYMQTCIAEYQKTFKSNASIKVS